MDQRSPKNMSLSVVKSPNNQIAPYEFKVPKTKKTVQQKVLTEDEFSHVSLERYMVMARM